MATRLLSLDLIKMCAMLGVVCLHTQQGFYDNPVAQFLYMTAAVSIPLFFMTSGYLLFGKETVSYRYSARKIVGILRFVAIITISFWLLSGRRHGSPFLEFTLGSLIQKHGMPVFWYFGAMMILYALLPPLHKLYNKHLRIFKVLTLLLCVLANGIFVANFFDIHIEQGTIQTFRVWNWMFYFNLGGILRRSIVKVNAWHILFLVIADWYFQYCLTPLMPTIHCEYFYSSVMVMALSSALFLYMRGIVNDKLQCIMGGGKLFLPVYAIHNIIIGHTSEYFTHYLYSVNTYTAPLYWLLVSAMAIIISWLLLKLPYMDKIFRI